MSQLNANVEGKDGRHQALIPERDFLQAGGEAKTMHKPKEKHHEQQVRHSMTENRPEYSEILQAFVHDRQRNEGVDEKWICGDPRQGGPKQGDAVSKGKRRNEGKNVPEAGQEKDHAKEKEKVVVAREHVLCPQPNRSLETAIGHDLFRAFRKPMSLCHPTRQSCNKEPEEHRHW